MDSAVQVPHASLVDTHCHVDLFPDPGALIREIERRQVYTIAVTNTPSVFPRLCEIVGESRYVRAALGLHPELASERHREMKQFPQLLAQTRYVGEVGLDYQTKVEAERAVQRRVLTAIIEQCDAMGGKVVTVHSRRAAEDVVSAFGDCFSGTYILHWYSGGTRALRRAITNGAYVSFNTAMMRSERGRALAAEVPRERVLTETDGPFITVDGVGAEPHHVTIVLEELAKLWDTAVDDVRRVVFANFAALLRAESRKP
jgi:TatD DNase family protein